MRNILEPFIEALHPRLDSSMRRIRLLGRSPKLRASARLKPLSRETEQQSDKVEAPGLQINKSVSAIANEITQKGFSRALSLNTESIESILAYCKGVTFYGDRNDENPTTLQQAMDTRAFEIAARMNPHLEDKMLQDISLDHRLWEIAETYFETTPSLLNTQIWISSPVSRPEKTSNYGFHYDIDGLKMLKIFFYLTDVSEQSGPHVFIERTHIEESVFKFFNRRISNKKAYARYRDRIRVLTGEAGCGVAEDTFGYHRAVKPEQPRIMLQIEFGRL